MEVATNMKLYAAVIVLLASVAVTEGKLNDVMKIVTNWSNCNKLSVYPKKSKVMFFGTQGQLFKLSCVKVYGGQLELERVTPFKYLGMILNQGLILVNMVFDQGLTFSQHCF